MGGCRAIWLPGVSATTFDASVCTLSGYWTKKFALKGPLNADNTITVGAEGYDSLKNIIAVYDISDAGYTKPTPALAEDGQEGFFNDLSAIGAMNPIGINAVNFCQCVAVAVNGCTPSIGYQDIPVADSLNFRDTTDVTGDLTAALNDEYNSVDQHINEALEMDGSNTFDVVDNDTERDAILAIFKSLPSKLNKCAPVARSLAISE